MISDAVTLERISRIIGYKLTKGDFSESSPNLPIRIAVFAEANVDNQADLDLTPFQITSAQQAGDRYGYGSPAYLIARILFPLQGDGVGGIPVFVYPQEEAAGAAAKILTVTPSGVATGNGTHTVKIAGRSGLDGTFYDINIVEGDTTADITAKISDAANAVLGCPMTATDDDYEAVFTSKWKGLTANGLSISVDNNGDDLGITYVVDSTQSGSATPSVQAALDLFGNNWNVFVLNSYGTVESVMAALEAFNGRPDPVTPTGRFQAIVMKPFVAITGSVDDDPTAITDARLDEVTIALAPAPGSDGLAMEAAANMCVLVAVNTQNTPHLDVNGQSYPDMPTPDDIGSMSSYNTRDQFVKKGCSTVDLISGKYRIQDFVTTYHKLGENPPQFRYVRNLIGVDMNIRYGYYLLEQLYVVDHAIAADNDTVFAAKVVKPKQWKAILFRYYDDLAKRGLITDAAFSETNTRVGLSTSNPDRLETLFKYKRTGVVRIASTNAEAGFNFGILQ